MLAWVLAVPLLVVLMYGIGLVVAYVLGEGSLPGVAGGASLSVLAWHGLRRLEPRPDGPPEDLAGALLMTAFLGAWIALAVVWTFWVVPIAIVVFWIWGRVAAADEED